MWRALDRDGIDGNGGCVSMGRRRRGGEPGKLRDKDEWPGLSIVPGVVLD